jgi:hypothetical protein
MVNINVSINFKIYFLQKGPFEIEVHHFPEEDMVNIPIFKIVLIE